MTDERTGSGEPGRGIIVWSWRGTWLFTVTAIAATALEDLRIVALVAALVLFTIGCVVFLLAFAVAVERSRTEAIGIGGLYFLSGSAPSRARRQLLGSLGIEVAVALVTASVRAFTSLAFGVLVPIYGLALAGLWGARHGAFESRYDEPHAGPEPDPASDE